MEGIPYDLYPFDKMGQIVFAESKILTLIIRFPRSDSLVICHIGCKKRSVFTWKRFLNSQGNSQSHKDYDGICLLQDPS
jgi:hypothetical protein